MKQVASVQAGGPDSLVYGDGPDPTPGAGQVLVRVRACGINYPDVLIIEDKYQFRPERPFAPGGEIAGEVISVGSGVERFSPGDHVVGITVHGGLAEKIALDVADCIAIPPDMPWDAAAALVFTFATSYHALHARAALEADETLLVLGAAGGVGLAAVQLGKAAGARVVAAVSSEEKAALAKQYGADEAIIYPSGPFEREERKALADLLKQAVGKGGADVVYDAVGGDYSEAGLRAIAWNGRFLVVGFPAGVAKIPLNLPLLKECAIVGVFWGAFTKKDPDAYRDDVRALLELWKAGKIAPHISARYPLHKGGCAISELGERRALGKIIVLTD